MFLGRELQQRDLKAGLHRELEAVPRSLLDQPRQLRFAPVLATTAEVDPLKGKPLGRLDHLHRLAIARFEPGAQALVPADELRQAPL